jgi:hypothetical protein
MLLMLTFTCAVMGCSSVVSHHPIGNTPVVLVPEDWEGIWVIEDGVAFIKVFDSAQGVVRMAWVEEEDQDFRLRTITVKLMEGNAWQYWNIIAVDGTAIEEEYLWGKLEKHEQEIVVWFPELQPFKEAINAHTIQGEVREERQTGGMVITRKVLLHDSPQHILSVIEAHDTCIYFQCDDPGVLRRFGEEP